MNMKYIDSIKLIEAVSKRPALFDKGRQLYHNHKFKHRLWKETCMEVYKNWELMSMNKRIEFGRELQKRWKNLRTCFARELSLQNKEYRDILDGREVKKRKRYEYFDKMLFLLNHEQKTKMEKIISVTAVNHLLLDRNDAVDCQNEVDSDSNEYVDGQNEVDSANNSDNVKTELLINYDHDDNMMYTEPPEKVEDPFINTKIVVKDENLNAEEDKLFLLSLLNTFSKFDDRQRFEAKIQILQMLRNIQYPDD